MADSTVTDFSKLKVIELRNELKARGLPTSGDKSELVARLTASQDDFALDSDELDSDGVLEDEVDEKSAADISLDDSQAHDFNDDLVEEEKLKDPEPERKPKTLKRKLVSAPQEKKAAEPKKADAKIVLHRPPFVPVSEPKTDVPAEDTAAVKPRLVAVSKVAPAADETKLEARAKRFGLPLTDEQRKEARKLRFGGSSVSSIKVGASSVSSIKVTQSDSQLEKLKKRAERFGQSVSKAMADVEAQARLDKRSARFAVK